MHSFDLMRLLSVLLIGCILSLSLVGSVNPADVSRSKNDCCRKMGDGNAQSGCRNKKGRQQNDGCGKQSCNMLLSCTACGFFGVEPIRLSPKRANTIQQPVPLYKIGNLTAYHSSDWKPPKTC
jgi:hypothetical protein